MIEQLDNVKFSGKEYLEYRKYIDKRKDSKVPFFGKDDIKIFILVFSVILLISIIGYISYINNHPIYEKSSRDVFSFNQQEINSLKGVGFMIFLIAVGLGILLHGLKVVEINIRN